MPTAEEINLGEVSLCSRYDDYPMHNPFMKQSGRQNAFTMRQTTAFATAVIGATLISDMALGEEIHCGVHEAITRNPTVSASGSDGELSLKPEEKVALAFMASIASIEFWCVQQEQHSCTMEQLVKSDKTPAGSPVGCLKYDPGDDKNYTYTVTISEGSWDAQASSKTKGLMSFHFKSSGNPYSPATYYKPRGVVGQFEKELTGYSITGESFELP